MLDPIYLADHVEAHWPGVDGVPVPWLLYKLDSVVGENGVNLVRHDFEHMLKEFPGCLPVGLVDELSRRELARPIDADEQISFSFRSLNLGNVDVDAPYRIALELRPLRFVPFHLWQTRDATARRHRCSADRVR